MRGSLANDAFRSELINISVMDGCVRVQQCKLARIVPGGSTRYKQNEVYFYKKNEANLFL
jgi:hypothetical protein